MKTKTIPISTFLILAIFFSSQGKALTLDDLKKTLGKYCVPSSNTDCNYDDLAEWKDNKCICHIDSKIWNAEERICEECEENEFPYNNEKCQPIICPAGTYKITIHNDVCPAGTYKITKSSTCPSGSYKHNYSID